LTDIKHGPDVDEHTRWRALTGEDTSTATSSAASPMAAWYSSEKYRENNAISSNEGEPYSSSGYNPHTMA